MLTRRVKKKIPKEAVEPLVETCETYSELTKKPAEVFFERFLGLMKKYEDYFFMEPWPKEFDHHRSLEITDEDLDFLCDGDHHDFYDRLTTVCLRKNMFLKGGFMGFWGMVWTRKAVIKVVFGPLYEDVFDAFQRLRNEGKTTGDILAILKQEHSCKIIHDSLIDFLEHNCPDVEMRKAIDDMVELLHSAEGLPSCGYGVCCWYDRNKYGHIKSP